MKSTASKPDEYFEIIITYPYIDTTHRFLNDQDPDGKEKDVTYEHIRQIWIQHNESMASQQNKIGDKYRYPVIRTNIDVERPWYFQPEIAINLVVPDKYSTETFTNIHADAQKAIEKYFHEVYFHYQVAVS
jgi:hypothetical protein